MPPTRWTDSIENQVGYSGGALLTDYTSFWDHSLSCDDVFGTVLHRHETTDANQFDHVVAYPRHFETEGRWRVPRSFIPRMLCHVVVNRIPDEALPEFCETLGQMLEFYSPRPPVERLPHEETSGTHRSLRKFETKMF